MLLNRIRTEIDPILRKNQNGFRKNRSTTGQILTIRRILEGVNDTNLPLTLLFIDFSKAFDTINREMMKDELASDLLLWNPKHGKRSRGRPRKSYIDQLKEDTMLKIEELLTAMNDRNEWKLRVMKCRASSTW